MDHKNRANHLKNSRTGRDVRKGGLDAAGRVGRKRGLDQPPLQVEGRRSRGLKVAGVLLGGPFPAGAPADKGENSHSSLRSLAADPPTSSCPTTSMPFKQAKKNPNPNPRTLPQHGPLKEEIRVGLEILKKAQLG